MVVYRFTLWTDSSDTYLCVISYRTYGVWGIRAETWVYIEGSLQRRPSMETSIDKDRDRWAVYCGADAR